MSSSLRKLKAYMTGGVSDPATGLQAASIPVSEADCRNCANPCDQGHDEYPSRFDVDMETQMLGSVKPYARQLVISTGKSDWEKEVTDAQGTLAAYLSGARGERPPKSKSKRAGLQDEAGGAVAVPGVYNSSDASKVTLLNGSHNSISEDPMHDTVFVFPDYKVVTEVPRSETGAKQLWKSIGSNGAPPESGELKTWVLPYSCVIMLCSHKRRDNRCAIAAPKLEHSLTLALEREGWEVHTQLEDPALSGTPLEELSGTDEDKQAEILRRLKNVYAEHADQKRALIIRNSHMGGHKFAGNIIINMPQGASVWYGRVTPHEVDAIVKETVVGGKILPPLLRGGLNLVRPGHTSLHDW
ncbi:uncharacterized protein FIBRA_01453 [Fibroporia radiculosa]|uniref:Altered inheritance of mitochondria protein 32 n=1 Tax=Fibroporia radiculosa TaxID=599839 RepID=J4GK97_9APHY|nr:uncharacterized protein FIBRA_01453 [Fibroporia radiculosa]CCL99435.1 predicted protein [Fibroporia radiculosa]